MSRVPFTYEFPRPAVTCDTVVFTMRSDDLAVLLVQRKAAPFRGGWALPGGFLEKDEPLERAAARELHEETGLSGLRLVQLGTFGDPGRDPRGHTITIAFVSFTAAASTLTAGDDARAVEWTPLRWLVLDDVAEHRTAPRPRRAARKSAPPGGEQRRLAFDHAKIVARAYRRLCRHLDDPVHDGTFDLVPPRFTLAELLHLYEIVLGRDLNPRWFSRFLVDRGLVVPVSTSKRRSGQAAELYRWNKKR